MTTEPYGKKNPYPSVILDRKNITASNSKKEIIHIEFDLTGSGMEYTAGDALAVIPANDPALVDQLTATLNICPDAQVSIPDGTKTSLRDALIHHYDISCVNKGILNKWQAFASNPELEELLSHEDKEAVNNYCWGADLIDVAMDYPAEIESGEALVGILRKIAPRLYSIASSPNAHPGQVHLCVGVVRYQSRNRQRGGICSTYMSDRVNIGETAKVFIHNNKNFRLPEDKAKPVIMVGPGTGIAPFRAFWEERCISNATGKNWFFFGNPHQATDFCYEDEVKALVEKNCLKLSVAWSRDQEQKVYVQNLMEQSGAEIWQWLQDGAYLYVCGDASRMAKDVDAALHKIIEIHGGKTTEEASEYVSQLKKDKRYQRDVY